MKDKKGMIMSYLVMGFWLVFSLQVACGQQVLIFSALSVTTIPVLIVYFIFQKQIVSGLTTGAPD